MDNLVAMIFGQSGAGVIVGTIMGIVKQNWKPKNKQLYWIPAFLISAVASYGILWYLDSFSLWVFLLSTIGIAGFQYVSENEAFDLIKKIFKAILVKLK